MRRTFLVRATRTLDTDELERVAALRAERLIEVELVFDGTDMEPFRLSIVAPTSTEARDLDAYMRDFNVGFGVDRRVIDLWQLSCARG